MVVGNGLMAKTFAIFQNSPSIIVFASGVSNSQETDESLFHKEQALFLKAAMKYPHCLFVYFSTCSIGDPQQAETPYVLHKRTMERLIQDSVLSYLIFRLPQIIGRSDNPHTLGNYLYNQIVHGVHFKIWKHAKRYLIDAEDVARIGGLIITDKLFVNATINIALRQYSILEIVNVMELTVGRKGIYSVVDSGAAYQIDTLLIQPVIQQLRINNNADYLNSLISKYYAPPL